MSARNSGTVSTAAAQGARVGLGVDEAVRVSFEAEPPAPPPPPPQSYGDGQSASQKPSGSKKQKREMNKDFKDLQETGRWGTISRRETYIVAGIGLLVVIAVIVAVLVLTIGGDSSSLTIEGDSSSLTPPPAPTASPTAKVVLTPEEQLTIIRAATIGNPATESSLSLLPEDAAFYVDKAADPNESPVVRAASWIMYDDPWDQEEWLKVRYSLAVLFYTTGGASWFNSSGWLTDDTACAWNGIRCDRFSQRVEEIDLSENNMSGFIPNEVGMIPTLVSLWLRRNKLTGNVPSLALGAMPSLSILYLDQNNLNGTISVDLAASSSLSKYRVGIELATLSARSGNLTTPVISFCPTDTLFLQANTLTGFLPREFCPDERTNVTGLREFGIDCNEMACFCCWPENCF
jgi:hypothetical protein